MKADQQSIWSLWLVSMGLGLLGTACGLLLLLAAMLFMRI